MAKEVMNEEVKMNEETVEVTEVKKESKIKVIFNKIKKPLAYAAVLVVGIGVGLAAAKGLGSDDTEVEETAAEE